MSSEPTPDEVRAPLDDNGYFARAFRDARQGKDDSCGRDLLHGFCSAVEQREAIPAPILEYLYAGITAYLAGERDLEGALFLKNAKGRPDNSNRIRIRDGRIYTGLVIAALLQILIKRGMKREAALALLEDRNVCPERTAERYSKERNALPDYTTGELRRMIRDAREVEKCELSSEQRERLTAKK